MSYIVQLTIGDPLRRRVEIGQPIYDLFIDGPKSGASIFNSGFLQDQMTSAMSGYLQNTDIFEELNSSSYWLGRVNHNVEYRPLDAIILAPQTVKSNWIDFEVIPKHEWATMMQNIVLPNFIGIGSTPEYIGNVPDKFHGA
jgi:hypothetical protein